MERYINKTMFKRHHLFFVFLFFQDRFTKSDDWKFLVATIQQKILHLSQDAELKRVCFFYKKILKGGWL